MLFIRSVRLLGVASLILGVSSAVASTTRKTEADSLISSDHTKNYALPTVSDTLVGISATQNLSNKTISGLTNTLSILPVSVQMVQELPSGTVNGTNTSFTLSFIPPNASGVLLTLDGITLIQGSGQDYTVSGATITMLTAPAAGQNLYAVYSKY